MSEQQLACEALAQTPNLTMTAAPWVEATETTPQYCYIKGIISPAIVYPIQLPLPENWNGRLLNIGDGANSTHFHKYDNVCGERDEPISRRDDESMPRHRRGGAIKRWARPVPTLRADGGYGRSLCLSPSPMSLHQVRRIRHCRV